MLQIGIIVFDKIEELDFVAPFELLSYANKIQKDCVCVKLIAEQPGIVKAFNGLQFMPDATFDTIDKLDILIVPGGKGRLTEMYNKNIHHFIARLQPQLRYLTSVCTGALILAEGGFLQGYSATTHHLSIDELRQYKDITVYSDQKVVACQKIITAAGVSSGLELGFYLLQVCFGEEFAAQVAKGIEYQPQI